MARGGAKLPGPGKKQGRPGTGRTEPLSTKTTKAHKENLRSVKNVSKLIETLLDAYFNPFGKNL